MDPLLLGAGGLALLIWLASRRAPREREIEAAAYFGPGATARAEVVASQPLDPREMDLMLAESIPSLVPGSIVLTRSDFARAMALATAAGKTALVRQLQTRLQSDELAGNLFPSPERLLVTTNAGIRAYGIRRSEFSRAIDEVTNSLSRLRADNPNRPIQEELRRRLAAKLVEATNAGVLLP